ncbi:DUF3164 family protein [Vibrio splendidus]|uniref:DUF3164 family protein n=1 Tax=Vibrio splendidus TaxID=29497 RepID=UPI000D363F72|nr:DUF3164 family protein [Vibrio splendidus]PTP90114.1 sulfate transporter [Vibrio splendidus]
MTEAAVEGYMKDRKGRLVPITAVSDYDIEMNDFVLKHVAKAREAQTMLKEFKRSVYDDCYAFIDLLAEKYASKKRLGGQKGNITFSAFDGSVQVTISIQDRIKMGPELKIAEDLIKACADEWSTGAMDEFKVLAYSAFKVDKEGNINTNTILDFRRQHKELSTDKRWVHGMDAIADAVMVIGSKTYLNFKERNGEGKLKNIPLDLAAL